MTPLSLLALCFCAVLVAALPPRPPQRPEDLQRDVQDDLLQELVDLEDARLVDEAYDRLMNEDRPAEYSTPPNRKPPEAADYDGELPQGDMPAEDEDDDQAQVLPSDDLTTTTSSLMMLSPPPLTPSRTPGLAALKLERESNDTGLAERNKEMRLQTIKAQILSYLGLSDSQASRQQMDAMRDMVARMQFPLPAGGGPQHPAASTDVYTEKVHSHYPSCSLPRNTDEELWAGGSAMNLLFDLAFPSPVPGTTVNIVQARLRLFKHSRGNGTLAMQPPCAAPSTASAAAAPSSVPLGSELLEGSDTPPLTTPLGTLIPPAEDRQVRVSIYWYTRSVKKNRIKRKLLDSRMLSVFGSQWTEWNVRQAARVWRESGRNFGLVVEVEDEDGTLLPAKDFFNGMNCSQEASTARPLPSFLLDAARRLYQENGSTPGQLAQHAHTFNQDLFPMIDLCTVEVADGEGAATYTSSMYAARGGSLGDRHAQPHPHLQHKHRHPHQRHRQPGLELPSGRDFPDDDIRKFIIPQRIVVAARHVAEATSDTPHTQER